MYKLIAKLIMKIPSLRKYLLFYLWEHYQDEYDPDLYTDDDDNDDDKYYSTAA